MAEKAVPATFVADLFGPGGDVPGAFDFRGDPPMMMRFRCPCGCGDRRVITLRPGAAGGSPSWEVSGSRDKPTLSPSLHLLGDDMRTHWHGWLRNGEFVSC